MATRIRILIVLLAPSVFCPALLAQNAQLAGMVSDTSRAVIPGSSVRIVNRLTHESPTTSANGSGFYQLLQLTPGTYEVTASAVGFETEVVEDVTHYADRGR